MKSALEFLTAAWNWFNGSKTKIGAALLAIAALLPEGIMILGYDLKAVLISIGSIFTGVGLVHIAVKANTQPGATA